MSRFELKTIGEVRAPFSERKSVPRLGGAAAIEVYPEYADALHRIEKHSHLWVLAWLHHASRGVLQVIPRGIADRADENLHGVFSVRSPVRPNPIGLTLAKIVSIDGLRIEVDRLDFMDGTPVIDLKPYFLSRDAIYSARNEQIGKPLDREALRESLLMQAVNFHGEECADVELAVDIFTDFRAAIPEMAEPKQLRITVPAARPHMIDAFIGMTRVTLGKGTLRMTAENEVKIECEVESAVYRLAGGGVVRSDSDHL